MVSNIQWDRLWKGMQGGKTFEQTMTEIERETGRSFRTLEHPAPRLLPTQGEVNTLLDGNQRALKDGVDVALGGARGAVEIRAEKNAQDLQKLGGEVNHNLTYADGVGRIGRENFGYAADRTQQATLDLLDRSTAAGAASEQRVLGGHTLAAQAAMDSNFRNRQLEVGRELATRPAGFGETLSQITGALAPLLSIFI